MPDLPNVGMERDLTQFVEYFENPGKINRSLERRGEFPSHFISE